MGLRSALYLPAKLQGLLWLLATYQPTLSAGPARGWQSSLGLAEEDVEFGLHSLR